MQQNTYIVSSWNKEVIKQVKETLKEKKNRYNKYIEFKESICDMFTLDDFYYYSDVTGLKIETIKNLAKFSPDHNDYKNATREARIISNIIGSNWAG